MSVDEVVKFSNSGLSERVMANENCGLFCGAPSEGFSATSFNLCSNYRKLGTTCGEVHGEELNLWSDRQIELDLLYKKHLCGSSYTENLREKSALSSRESSILCDSLPDLHFVCEDDLETRVFSKSSVKHWTFKIITDKSLHVVALLHDQHRLYFAINDVAYKEGENKSVVSIESAQELFVTVNRDRESSLIEYAIIIRFKSEVYGTFRQTVVFDFGLQNVIAKNIVVDVVPEENADELKHIIEEVTFVKSKRWGEDNAEIIDFVTEDPTYKPHDDFHRYLLDLYPYPRNSTLIVPTTTFNCKQVNEADYRHVMHDLLFVEELARNKEIDNCSVNAQLHVVDKYLLSSTSVGNTLAKYANFKEMYAYTTLGQDLSEDTPAGRLILRNCNSVLIIRKDDSLPENGRKTRVYEAIIEDKGKSVLYLRLSAATVAELNLSHDSSINVQIQFRLDRQIFCEWHFAVDEIQNLKLIFPDVDNNYFLVPWSPEKQWSTDMDSRLNVRQKEAVLAVTASLNLRLPPVLIIGPFGTGKTFTIAQAIKQLTKQSGVRILVCTHSNSAADLYIKDYIHPYVQDDHFEAKPLRIYYTKRWVSTVHPIVQQYCLIQPGSVPTCFAEPTLNDLVQHKIVVVTLSTSICLNNIGVPKGFFTHIFLDEAAQTIECEMILPLSLATADTRIVLAGDHMQLNPEIFSSFAKDRRLHVSLLQRLYEMYPGRSTAKIHLRENYRSHNAIVQFTSTSFYDEKLISSGKQAAHPVYHPLTFFAVLGEDKQDVNSTAFHNDSEVYEIVERVTELKRTWPTSKWGKFDESSLGIMTPYADQVFRIRRELRKKRLKDVVVERVANVQGKQFRVIILSTVRTRLTCEHDDLKNEYGFLSNLHLLNTAITRAQSLVMVVGDPIALCSIGRCLDVWKRYVEVCSENKSLYGMELKSIEDQLLGLEFKRIYGLNPMAPEFVPKQRNFESYIHVAQSSPPPLLPPPPSAPPVHLPPVNCVPEQFPRMEMRMPFRLNESARNTDRLMPNINGASSAPNRVEILENVHLPTVYNRNSRYLLDYLNILPPNMSLANFLLQPSVVHYNWYLHLLRTVGPEAAARYTRLLSIFSEPDLINHTPWMAPLPIVNNVRPPPPPQQPTNVNPAGPDQPTYAQQLINSNDLFLRQSNFYGGGLNGEVLNFNRTASLPLYQRGPCDNGR